MSTDLVDTIRGLLALADPAGAPHARLQRMLDRVAQRVLLSTHDLRFLQDLVDLRDNIPCAALAEGGFCPRTRAPCAHHARYRTCPLYEDHPRGTAAARHTPLGGIA